MKIKTPGIIVIHNTILYIYILGLTKGDSMIASCHPSDLASHEAFKELGAESIFENTPVVKKSEIVIISVKPQVVPVALGDIKNDPSIDANKLFLSIAMGITIKQLESVRKKLYIRYMYEIV